MSTTAPLSLEDTIAKAAGEWGLSWPNKWWPGGNPSYNDCAKFVGWLLGDSTTYLVSDIQLRRGYEFHAGSDGIRRGDIPGWNWDGASPGNYDHTGIVSRVVGDTVFSIDANSGSTDSVGEYGRSRAYITSYVRPIYPGVTPAGNSTEGDDSMSAADVKEIKDYLEGRILDGVRREGGARLRTAFDGGPHGTELPWDKAPRAAQLGRGFVKKLDENASARAGQFAQARADRDSIILPWAENPARFTTTGFLRECDGMNDPYSPFGSWKRNWIDLNPAVPGTTWMERVDGKRYPFQTRLQVWADLRQVECLYDGVKVDQFLKRGSTYMVVAGGKTVTLTQESIDRANRQIAFADAKGNPITGTQAWVSV